MFCSRCGAPIPEGSVFCSNCGSQVGAPNGYAAAPRVPRRRTKGTLGTNLLKTVLSFFSKQPERSLAVAARSRTHEWSILLGVNVLLFALAYTVNIRQILVTTVHSFVKSVSSRQISSFLSEVINFGPFLLFGLLIGIFSVALVFGAYVLMEKGIQRGQQDIVSMLNTTAVATLPFTVVFVVNMILGLIWGFLVIPFLLIAALAQALLLYEALQVNEGQYRVNLICFLGVSMMVLCLTLLFGFLFTKGALTMAMEDVSDLLDLLW